MPRQAKAAMKVVHAWQGTETLSLKRRTLIKLDRWLTFGEILLDKNLVNRNLLFNKLLL